MQWFYVVELYIHKHCAVDTVSFYRLSSFRYVSLQLAGIAVFPNKC